MEQIIINGRVEGQDNNGQRGVSKPDAVAISVYKNTVKIRLDSTQIPSFWCELSIPLEQIMERKQEAEEGKVATGTKETEV